MASYFLPNCTAFLLFWVAQRSFWSAVPLVRPPSHFLIFIICFSPFSFIALGRICPFRLSFQKRNFGLCLLSPLFLRFHFFLLVSLLISSFCGFKLFLFPSFLRWKFIANSFYKKSEKFFCPNTEYVFQLLWTVTLWDSLRGEAV